MTARSNRRLTFFVYLALCAAVFAALETGAQGRRNTVPTDLPGLSAEVAKVEGMLDTISLQHPDSRRLPARPDSDPVSIISGELNQLGASGTYRVTTLATNASTSVSSFRAIS
jgi:hypothetical protein